MIIGTDKIDQHATENCKAQSRDHHSLAPNKLWKIDVKYRTPEATSAPENSVQSAPSKPLRLAFRISAASALKLRRIARSQTRALRRLGISSVQLDQQQLATSSGCSSSLSLQNSLSQVRIPSRTPSPEVARRESRQQQLLQQRQRLHQLAQHQLALVAQHFRGQPSAEIFSPHKVSPPHFRPAARLPGPPAAASVPVPTCPLHHTPPSVVHQTMDRQPQPGPSTVTPGPMITVAENSPLLVDLLSSSVPPQPHNQQTAPAQQQKALPSQQRVVGNVPLQQTSSQPLLTPQQRQYQQHLYQQQMHQQRVQQAQQQQNSFIFGPGGASAISGQMNHHQPAIVGSGHQPPHPFMMQPQMMHQQIRPHGTPGGGGLSASPHGIVPMASACGMPPPYAMQSQQQQQLQQESIATIAAAKTNHHVAEAEEPPKKRKRISKKQQQKEEKEREQQLRLQQEAALVQMHQRQQQQLFFHQRQMAMQQQGMTVQGLVGAPQQNYQQHIAQYQHQQHYAAQSSQQHNNQPNLFNSPPHGNSLGGHYANQQNAHTQPSPQQQYPPLGAAQSATHYMSPPGMWGASPQNQNISDYQQQSQMAVAGQNPPHPLPTVMHLPSQQQQQQQFRTPGTPGSAAAGAMCYGHSPATTTCSASTPFHSPQSQQQQMVGTPSGGQNTPIGGGPTPPYGNSHGNTGSVHQQHQSQRGTPVGSGGSTVEHSRTNTPQQQFSLHSVQQHSNNNNNQSYHQGPPSHQSLQQMSPAEFYQQQKPLQTKQRLQQSPMAQQYHPTSASTSVFPQLSDFAEDGLVDDLVVPSISNEEDFDLDSIEPMRCGDHQQGYHQNQQHQQNTNHIEMSVADKTAAEMEMLPDRSPQIGDKPLSPSKLSETQDRNVTDAIASVMERVAKSSSKNSRIKTVTHKTTSN